MTSKQKKQQIFLDSGNLSISNNNNDELDDNMLTYQERSSAVGINLFWFPGESIFFLGLRGQVEQNQIAYNERKVNFKLTSELTNVEWIDTSFWYGFALRLSRS